MCWKNIDDTLLTYELIDGYCIEKTTVSFTLLQNKLTLGTTLANHQLTLSNLNTQRSTVNNANIHIDAN